MAYTQQKELEAIRHFTGTLSDFKNFFDQKAAETAKKNKVDTNAYGTPHYQGFNDVHPTRGANASPHWDESVQLQEAVGIGTLAATAIGAGILIRLGLMSNDKYAKTMDAAKDTAKEAGKALKAAGIALARELPIIGKKMKRKELEAWQQEELQKYVNDEITDKDAIETLSKNPDLKEIIDKIAAGSSSYRPFYDHIKWIMDKGGWSPLNKKFIKLRKKLMKGEVEESVHLSESNSISTKVDRIPLFEDFQG